MAGASKETKETKDEAIQKDAVVDVKLSPEYKALEEKLKLAEEGKEQADKDKADQQK